MKVGIDLRSMDPSFKAHYGRGIGRYAAELSSEFATGLPEEYGCSVSPLSADQLRGTAFERRLLDAVPVGKVTLETQFVLPRSLRSHEVDLIHFVAHGDAPIWSTVPFVATVLDLIPMRFPELYKGDRPDWRFRLGRYLENQSIRRAAGLIVISEATKKDVRELFQVPEDRIAVTHLAVHKSFRPLSFRDAIRRTEVRHIRTLFGLSDTRPILLYVGGVDPRKNVPFLLEVFAELLKSYGPFEPRPILAITGNNSTDENYPRVLETISRLGVAEDILLFGFLKEEELVRAYQCSDLLVFPSLYEGFGLPVLEAFSCGLAVVAGKNSSLPEICGSSTGASLLEDNNKDAWVREIKDLLRSTERRLEMGRSGVQRARDFSWESTARKTLAAYQEFGRVSRLPESPQPPPLSRAVGE